LKQLQWRKDDRLKPTELHEFFEFQRHVLDSGESLEFPTRAEYTSFTGIDDEGQPIAFMRRIITLEGLALNRRIPDEFFVIEFPANAKILEDLSPAWKLPR
jgi:hypothetical protein